jgi:hypothetical protein
VKVALSDFVQVTNRLCSWLPRLLIPFVNLPKCYEVLFLIFSLHISTHLYAEKTLRVNNLRNVHSMAKYIILSRSTCEHIIARWYVALLCSDVCGIKWQHVKSNELRPTWHVLECTRSTLKVHMHEIL